MASRQHRGVRRIRARWLAAVGALAASAAVLPAAARTAGPVSATPPPVTALNCVEHEVWAHGDPAAVAARMPAKYTPYMDNGAPLIFARAEHCDQLTAAGRTAPVTIADYGIVITSPDGYGCSSGLPQAGTQAGNAPPVCNWYTLALVTDDQRVVDWLRQGTPDAPVTLVPGLSYRMSAPDAQGSSTFHFEAPAPSPSAFTIDDVSSFRPGQIALRGAYYFPDAPQGAVKMLVSTDDLTGGHADTTLRAAPGSELATLMGATERPSVEPYNEFGVIRAAHGVLRKQLLGPALPGEALDSFAGSCSLQGDVTFDPPATNTQAQAVYTYDAKGTCTGTLDGKALDAAPVALHQSGHADASCVQAMSFPPGDGTVTFPGGTTLPYTLDFTSKMTELDGNAYGTRSGIATGHGTFLTQRSSPGLPLDCSGDGLKTAPMDMTFQTSSPLVSARSVPAPAPAPAAPAARPHAKRLRLSVSPAKARRGHCTRFRFRVRTSAKDQRAAVIRFAGHRVRARHGRATIVARLARLGRHVATASTPGFRPARTIVIVTTGR